MKQYLCTGDFFANLFDDFGWLLGYYYIRLLFASYEKSAFSLDSPKIWRNATYWMIEQQLIPVLNVCKHTNISMRYVCHTNALNLPAALTKVSSFEIRDLRKCIIRKTHSNVNLLLHSLNCFLHFCCQCTTKVKSFGVSGSQTCKDVC